MLQKFIVQARKGSALLFKWMSPLIIVGAIVLRSKKIPNKLHLFTANLIWMPKIKHFFCSGEGGCWCSGGVSLSTPFISVIPELEYQTAELLKYSEHLFISVKRDSVSRNTTVAWQSCDVIFPHNWCLVIIYTLIIEDKIQLELELSHRTISLIIPPELMQVLDQPFSL